MGDVTSLETRFVDMLASVYGREALADMEGQQVRELRTFFYSGAAAITYAEGVDAAHELVSYLADLGTPAEMMSVMAAQKAALVLVDAKGKA